MQRKPVEPRFIEAALTKTLGLYFSVWLIKDSFTAGLQAKDPSDLKITSIATAILNSTVPAASRAAGHENDVGQWAAISELPLKSVHCPTFILQGTADSNVPIAHGEFAHAQIAGSQFVRLPGEEHCMVITKHKQLGELIHTLLVEHAGAKP